MKKRILTTNATGILNNTSITALNGTNYTNISSNSLIGTSITTNTGGYNILSGGTYYSTEISNTVEYSICIEKLVSYSEETKMLLEKLLFKYLDNTYNTLVCNTLLSYGILEDKEVVERKAKITNILK